MRRLLTAAMIVVPTIAFAQGLMGAGKADPAVTGVADAYVKATLAGDAAALVMLYANDAVEMPPNQPMLKGKPAIEAYYKKMFGGPDKMTSFSLMHLESTASGDIAYDAGTYKQTMTSNGKPMNESGKYVVLLRKMGSDWRVTYAIYNSDQAPMMMHDMGSMPK